MFRCLISTYPKSTVHVVRMLMLLTLGYVTLLAGKISAPPKFSPNQTYGAGHGGQTHIGLCTKLQCFLSYLHEKCLDFYEIFRKCLRGITNSTCSKVKYSLLPVTSSCSIQTSEKMRKLDGKYNRFLEGLLCTLEACDVIPLYVGLLHHNCSYKNDTSCKSQGL